MKLELNPQQIGNAISRFLQRHNFVLFVIIVVGSMATIVWILNGIITQASDTAATANNQPQVTTFDSATLERVNALRSTSTQADLQIPANRRSNPFVE